MALGQEEFVNRLGMPLIDFFHVLQRSSPSFARPCPAPFLSIYPPEGWNVTGNFDELSLQFSAGQVRPRLKNGKTPSWGIFFRQDCVDWMTDFKVF